MFSTAVTKNLNWQYYLRIELILKDGIGIKKGHFRRGHWKIQFLEGRGEGGGEEKELTKNNI